MLKTTPSAPVDLGIVIALPEELRELLDLVADYTPQPDDDLDSFLFTRGNYRCAATLVGHMGEAQATRVAERLIAAFDPGSIISVGIAAGVHDDLRIGDVHVASQAVQYMQDGKASPAEPGGFVIIPGAPAYRADFTLHKAVLGLEFNHRRGHQAWREACRADLDALITDAEARERLFAEKVVRPEVKLLADGHLATGPVVGAAPAFSAWLRAHDRNIKALEMESAAVLLSAQSRDKPTRALAIRGISDYGDHRKADLDAIGEGALRRYAMRNAVHFLFALLEAEVLPRNPR